jgi:hypothetical protein
LAQSRRARDIIFQGLIDKRVPSVAADFEGLGNVPAGPIEQQDGVCARGQLGRDLIEMALHGFAIAGR